MILVINVLISLYNYPALVYYAVNSHMYVVRHKKKVKSLIERARHIEINIQTDMLEEEMHGENIFLDRNIFENIPVKNLMDEFSSHLQ